MESTEAKVPGEGKAAAPERTRRAGRRRFSLIPYSGLVIWGLFILIFALWVPDTFLTSLTLKNVLSEQAVTAIVALGLLFPLAAGAYDLSVGTTLAIAAVISAQLTAEQGASTPEAIVIALLVGALIGAINGLLVVGVGINSFIATLAMSSVTIAGIGALTGNNFIAGVPSSYQSLVDHQPLGIPQIALYVVGLAIICWYVLEHTPLGRRVSATGFGPEAARLAGVGTNRLVFASLIASGTFAAFAGVLLTAKLGTANPEIGSSYLLPAFAAAFLGSTQLKPGRFNVGGTILAILLLATGIKGLQLAGAAVWVTSLFNGVALIIAVGLSVIGQRLSFFNRFRRKAGKPA